MSPKDGSPSTLVSGAKETLKKVLSKLSACVLCSSIGLLYDTCEIQLAIT